MSTISPGHSFPVRKTFHMQSKNRNKIRRDIGRHILNDFELQHKEKRNLKSNPSYHLLKMAQIVQIFSVNRDERFENTKP